MTRMSVEFKDSNKEVDGKRLFMVEDIIPCLFGTRDLEEKPKESRLRP